jgi:uncharacterized phage protein (TIGR02220 family)
MEYLKVKNWEEFQHYKDRNPPWIKLHRGLLDNYEFCSLEDAQKAHLVMIWIHASQNDGLVPNDVKFLERKLSVSKLNLRMFVELGFLVVVQVASNALADGKQDAPRSVRLEEKRREEEIYAPSAREVIDYLNEKAGKAYEHVPANLKFIIARLKDGATVERCKAVVDARADAWLGDPKMAQYLRPETLFNATKFAGYSGELADAKPVWDR